MTKNSGWSCGEGDFQAYYRNKDDKVVMTKVFELWCGVRSRCSSEIYREKYTTYKSCSASEEFMDFQSFAKWAVKQVGFNQTEYHLDKDILVKGNKLYSEHTCCFVPHYLNLFFTSNHSVRGNYPIGVTYIKARAHLPRPYRAKIRKYDINTGKSTCTHIGYFTTAEEAFSAYKTTKELLAKEYSEKLTGSVDDRVLTALISYQVDKYD